MFYPKTSVSATKSGSRLVATRCFQRPPARRLPAVKSFASVRTEARTEIEEIVQARIDKEAAIDRERNKDWVDRFGNEPRKGADILIQALEREGVTQVFAYPGGASMEIHQALTRSHLIRNYLCRHEQGEIFAAEGYAKSSGQVGVCIATSGPGATNLITGLADAMMDSVPLVAITGQVARRLIGSEAFQETPIVEMTRRITKHNFMVMDVAELPRIVKEAFYLARSGRLGPVLIDMPKDVQQQLSRPDWDEGISLHSYISRLPPDPADSQLQAVVEAIKGAKKPVIFYGGGCLHAHNELRELIDKTGIPCTSTLMGLGAVPAQHPLHLSMLGMHGTVFANYAVDQADLLLAFGVRFDDRVTGKLEAFASRARIVHIDIDPTEINKHKVAHVPICADVKPALQGINRLLDGEPSVSQQFEEWRRELEAKRREFPMRFPQHGDHIRAEYAIQILGEETKGEAVVTAGVGQHQMWAAQWYPFKHPRQWVNSGGLGAMGFGLPAALGCAAAFDGRDGRPKRTVVDVDGDGSFLMNCQELATVFTEKLDTKIMLINNQFLGMVMQWEDRFYKSSHAHTYLGKPGAEWDETNKEEDIYPNFVVMASAFGVPARRITKQDEVREGIRQMLDTPGPFLLEVMTPHEEHVLPMIPSGATFKDIITEEDKV